MLGNKRIMGANIQYYMSKHGIERREFAKAIGVPYSSLTDWINGNTYPRIDKIQKMADYFHIEKADLVEDRVTRCAGMSPEIQELIEAAAGIPQRTIERMGGWRPGSPVLASIYQNSIADQEEAQALEAVKAFSDRHKKKSC